MVMRYSPEDRTGQRWTEEETARLRRMVNARASMGEISRALSRSTASIQGHLNSLRPGPDKEPSRKTRPCMCCRRPFPSAGPHNRLCENCRHLSNPFER